MSQFARDILRRADKHLQAADQLFEGSFPDPRQKEQAAAIVAKVTGNVYRVLGEFLTHQEASASQSEADQRRQAILERSNALRTAHAKAVATGNWTEYDRLSRDFGGAVRSEPGGTEGSAGDS